MFHFCFQLSYSGGLRTENSRKSRCLSSIAMNPRWETALGTSHRECEGWQLLTRLKCRQQETYLAQARMRIWGKLAPSHCRPERLRITRVRELCGRGQRVAWSLKPPLTFTHEASKNSEAPGDCSLSTASSLRQGEWCGVGLESTRTGPHVTHLSGRVAFHTHNALVRLSLLTTPRGRNWRSLDGRKAWWSQKGQSFESGQQRPVDDKEDMVLREGLFGYWMLVQCRLNTILNHFLCPEAQLNRPLHLSGVPNFQRPPKKSLKQYFIPPFCVFFFFLSFYLLSFYYILVFLLKHIVKEDPRTWEDMFQILLGLKMIVFLEVICRSNVISVQFQWHSSHH